CEKTWHRGVGISRRSQQRSGRRRKCSTSSRSFVRQTRVGLAPGLRLRGGAPLVTQSMKTAPLPARPIRLDEIREARQRIAKTIVRTPLIRLELGPDFPDVRLKLENLQPINAYKLRGAANAVALLSDSERERGVWTISAGNAGQGVAYAARQAG